MTTHQAKIGKLISGSLYIHHESLNFMDEDVIELVEAARAIVPSATDANVYRIDVKQRSVSLLCYPNFYETGFPELEESWRVYVDEGRAVYRTYRESTNPPILHRKELLLPPSHPDIEKFSALTKQAEDIGLFANTITIGFKNVWDALIKKTGYQLQDHQFQAIGNDTQEEHDDFLETDAIERHRTALSRQGLSAPMQTLARNGLIRDELSYFDYGCGRGDDLAALKSLNLNAKGWDPHYAPSEEKHRSDIVNLGFVLNVIEDIDERVAALQGAFELAEKLLVVSVMLYTSTPPAGKPYRDGYRTQRNTFQKYYSQTELKEFIEGVLDVEAIPVAPGIVYIFRDKQFEQQYLFGRQRNHHTLQLLGYRKAKQEKAIRQRRLSRTEKLFAENEMLIDTLWDIFLELGRPADAAETLLSVEAIAAFGSWSKAVKFVLAHKDVSDLELAAASHKDDLLVFLALQQFAKRKPYKSLEPHLQREIKFHFGDYQTALAQATAMFAQIANPAALNEACVTAAEKGLGYYVDSDYLQLDASLIEQLPALLRIYIGCATAIYGDLENIDVVKLHIRSSKVSLMRYDDFNGKALPSLQQRIKITLRTQEIDFFEYGEQFAPTLLYFKSRYINEDNPCYAEQLEFDQALEELNFVHDDGFGPSEEKFLAQLQRIRKEVAGFKLQRSSSIPSLDQPCGANFTYRDLVECGETWERLKIDNTPKESESYNALYDLAVNVLDPIIDYYGAIKLTYGFASNTLTKHIKSRIAPKLDQHAAAEKNTRGNLICDRGGAACDFIIEDEDSFEVMEWIRENIAFDRMYIYGRDRPIHISYASSGIGDIYEMKKTYCGKNYPLKITKKDDRTSKSEKMEG